MRTPTTDRQDQLQKIQEVLLPGEQIHSVYDCIGIGTGFVGLTSHRVIFQNRSFVTGKMLLTSIPFAGIKSVSLSSNKTWWSNHFSGSSCVVDTGGKVHDFSFRGHDRARKVHDFILRAIFANTL